MKTFIVILISLCSANLFAQNYWLPTGTMSPGNTDWVYSIDANASGELFASSWATGIYKSTDRVHWNFSGLTGKRVSRVRVAPNGDIYALSKTTSNSFIHKSTDNGVSWTDVYNGSFLLNYAGGGDIVFPQDGSLIAAFSVTVGPLIGDVGIFIFKSTDNGDSWFQIHSYLVGFVGGMVITADNKILMGTSLAGVICSTNYGATFTNLNSFPSIYIKTIIKAHDNTIYVSDAYGLNRSTNNGASFTAAAKTPFATVRDAITNSDGELFLSMDDRSVYRSTDRGDSWIQVNNGLPSATQIYSFTCVNDRVFAGTNNSGVFYFSPLTNVKFSNIISENFKLSQNYPNPFNPKTTIKYELGNESDVSITVHDILGNEIASIVNEKQQAGIHSAEWAVSDYPSGTYFYTIKAGSFTDTKSMLLLK